MVDKVDSTAKAVMVTEEDARIVVFEEGIAIGKPGWGFMLFMPEIMFAQIPNQLMGEWVKQQFDCFCSECGAFLGKAVDCITVRGELARPCKECKS